MLIIGGIILSITSLIVILSQMQSNKNNASNDLNTTNIQKRQDAYIDLNQNADKRLNLNDFKNENANFNQNPNQDSSTNLDIVSIKNSAKVQTLSINRPSPINHQVLEPEYRHQIIKNGIPQLPKISSQESADNLIKSSSMDEDNKDLRSYSSKNEKNIDEETKIAIESSIRINHKSDSKNNQNNQNMGDEGENLLPSTFDTTQQNIQTRTQNQKNYTSIESKKKSTSEYELKAGAFIFAMLNHQITSDIKGEVSAIVSQDVFDSTKGMHLLIPKGTQLNGSYENQVAFGQNRLAIAWHRLIFSDGSVFNLGNMPASDNAGSQGMSDISDHHYVKTFSGAILSSILNAGVNTQQNQSSWLNNSKNNLGNQVLEKTNGAAQNLINKNLQNQSTLVIRPGYRFTIKVNQDLIIN